jgi:chromosome segregation ATPase
MKAETKAGTGKTTADSAAVLTENALKMLEMLEPAQQEIDRLEARLKSANLRANDLEAALKSSQGRVNELEAEVQLLRNQVTVMTKEVTDLRVENSTLRGGG